MIKTWRSHMATVCYRTITNFQICNIIISSKKVFNTFYFFQFKRNIKFSCTIITCNVVFRQTTSLWHYVIHWALTSRIFLCGGLAAITESIRGGNRLTTYVLCFKVDPQRIPYSKVITPHFYVRGHELANSQKWPLSASNCPAILYRSYGSN